MLIGRFCGGVDLTALDADGAAVQTWWLDGSGRRGMLAGRAGAELRRGHVVVTWRPQVLAMLICALAELGRQCWRCTVELSIREAKARFTEAAAAAARGERVVVTKHGRPFIELVRAQRVSGMDFKKAAVVRCELGLDSLRVELPADFDDPAFSRRVLGLLD